MTTSGAFVREFATPALFNPGAGTGVRNNLAFESLALTPGGHTVYAATEMALIQDGPQTGEPGVTSVTRVQSYDRASRPPRARTCGRSHAVTTPSPRPFENNGQGIAGVGERQFLTVERSFTLPASYTIRLFLNEIAEDTTDVSGLTSLVGAAYTPMRKTPLLDLSDTAAIADDLGLLPSGVTDPTGERVLLDNIEGIALGPAFNGKPTLVLVADNNFAPGQFTQLLAFSITAPLRGPEAR